MEISFIGESVNSVGVISSQLVKLLANALTNELPPAAVTHGGIRTQRLSLSNACPEADPEAHHER